ncbi:hypothetical protein BY996DRAFT_6423375 [Phakopsora pachyrhizi]|nr:hypothetical protein BY996DRAFT_6423375 [Phakopsora pachyrhizi]
MHKKNLAPVQSDQSKNGPIQDARGSGRINCRVRNRNNQMVIAKREGSDCKRAITDWHIVTATYDFEYLNNKSKKAIKGFLKQESSSRILLHFSRLNLKYENPFLTVPMAIMVGGSFFIAQNKKTKTVQEMQIPKKMKQSDIAYESNTATG